MPIVLNGSGPITGVTSLNTTVSDTEIGYLDGVTSALQTQINGAGGLVKITDQSFSAVSSVSVNSCFTATYSNYRLLVNITAASASSTYNIRMRASGADNTTANYARQNLFAQSSTAGGSKATSASAWLVGQYNSANTYHAIAADFFGPQKTQATTTLLTKGELDAGDYTAQLSTLIFTLTTAFDGFSIYADSGTFTGTLAVYGYRN